MTEILISTGYGAGWTTWNEDKYRKFALTYRPFIDKLKRGEDLNEADETQFLADLEAEFGPVGYFCTLGLEDLEVIDVSGDFIVEEYDGSESVMTRDNDYWTNVDETS